MGLRTRGWRFVARRRCSVDTEQAERVAVLPTIRRADHRREPSRRAICRSCGRQEGSGRGPGRAWRASGTWKPLDEQTDARPTEILSDLPKPDRRRLIRAYLGHPFYDVATLPLLQGAGLDQFDPTKVDRISPDDVVASARAATAATLKGIQFDSFGAFFSRAYRENHYRGPATDHRLIHITLSTLPTQPVPATRWRC